MSLSASSRTPFLLLSIQEMVELFNVAFGSGGTSIPLILSAQELMRKITAVKIKK